MTPRLLRAFRSAHYGAGGASIRVGRRCAAMDRVLGARQGVFLGAWNPHAARHPIGWNERMDRNLQGWLRQVAALPGSGFGPGWSEAHWLVVADPRRAIVLARRFRQSAVIMLRQGQVARLRLLDAASTR